ncbi:MAG TPA: acyltransferase [Candidatus Dormibacteraeota bacterium]
MQKRYESLDGLRGLAALTVVIYHTLFQISLPTAVWTLVPPVSVFWAGRQAVVLFFVLSGFVLALPFHQGRAQPYVRFVLKRALRLYPVYALAILLSAAWAAVLTSHFAHTGLLSTTDVLALYLPMVGPYHVGIIDQPVWTLIHEIRISLVFPALLALIRGRWGHLPALLLLSAGAAGLAQLTGNDLFGSVGYVPMFLIGAWLARHHEQIRTWYGRRPLWQRLLWMGAGVGLYGTSARELGLPYTLWQIPLTVGGGLLLVSALAEPAFSGFLMRRPLQLLGAMSYSLYLIHGLVLWPLMPMLLPRMPALEAAALCWILIFAATYLTYRFVELPSMRLSRLAWLSRAPRRYVQELGPQLGAVRIGAAPEGRPGL